MRVFLPFYLCISKKSTIFAHFWVRALARVECVLSRNETN